VPTLIQWDCAKHPADNLDDRDCELIALEGAHPTPARIAAALRTLGADKLIELRTSAPELTARIRGPHGVCTITS